MLTPEGADDADIIVRPTHNGSWQVELPTAQGIRVFTLRDEHEALVLARVMRPQAAIRILPATEPANSRDDNAAPDGEQSA